MDYGSIYMLQFPNGKIYIGQTNNFVKRMGAYPSSLKRGKSLVVQAIKHYGWDSIVKKEILRTSLNLLDFYERRFIKLLNTTDKINGYNLETGGKKHKKATRQLREKLSIAHLGHKHTKESREKISNTLKKMVRNPESYKKAAEKRRGRKMPESSIEKMKITKAKGFRENRYRKTTTPILLLNKDTLKPERYFESIAEAGKTLNICRANISAALRGKRKLCGGYAWKYAGEENPRFVPKPRKTREWTEDGLRRAMIHYRKPKPEKRVPIMAIDADTGQKIYEFSGGIEVKRYGLKPSTVCYCLKHQDKTYKGLYWRYVERRAG